MTKSNELIAQRAQELIGSRMDGNMTEQLTELIAQHTWELLGSRMYSNNMQPAFREAITKHVAGQVRNLDPEYIKIINDMSEQELNEYAMEYATEWYKNAQRAGIMKGQ